MNCIADFRAGAGFVRAEVGVQKGGPMADVRDGSNVARARVAFYGRVARGDKSQVMVKHQLAVVKQILPASHGIVGFFADVAPWDGLSGSICSVACWRLDGERVNGGLVDLLDRACAPEPEFDVVACVDRDRLSVRLADRARIEDTLACRGIQILTPVGVWLLSGGTQWRPTARKQGDRGT